MIPGCPPLDLSAKQQWVAAGLCLGFLVGLLAGWFARHSWRPEKHPPTHHHADAEGQSPGATDREDPRS
jgi:hypothetical protein